MAITVAVTGGIGAGKSTVSGLLQDRGAIVIDSDKLAREVVAPGTPGLAAIVALFGGSMVAADGSLNRPALAAIVFSDPAARRLLEGITHPLIKARFLALSAAAPRKSVVVNDIPLLTTSAAAATYHLVVGVGAPESLRIARLVDRGVTAGDAQARVAAQIDDGIRRMLCDVWIDNSGAPERVNGLVGPLWDRLLEFCSNTESSRGAARSSGAPLTDETTWLASAQRLIARVRGAVGDPDIGVTTVPGQPADGMLDLLLTLTEQSQAIILAPLLSQAGFPAQSGSDAGSWHVNADPGQGVNIYLRVADELNFSACSVVR